VRKVVVLYRPPAEPETFDRAYFETHLPIVNRVPGLARVEISDIVRTLHGDLALHRMVEMYFPDGETLKTALRSPEWAEAGRNLAGIGGLDIALMYTAEVTDPTRQGSRDRTAAATQGMET